MLNEEQLDILSDVIKPMFQNLEHEVIVDIARRIKKTMTYTRTAELMAMDMQKLGYSPAKIRAEALKILNADAEFKRIVERNTIEYKKAVQEMIDEIVKDASEIGNEIISNAGNMSWIDDMRVWESSGQRLTDDSYLSTLQKAIAEQTIGEMLNLTNTTGFKTMSGYEPMMNAFRIELDKAMIKLCTGTFSQEKVLNDVIHNLAQSGLRSIDYASGRSMQIDTAAKQALRTGCNQISGKIMDENIIRSGQNLVYVSGHWGARNEGVGVANHEQWQSRVYYISDEKDYSEEAKRIGQDAISDIWISTGYSPDGSHENNPLGLHGYNCRHSHRVWFEGVSSLPKEQPEPEPVMINGKTYNYYAITKKMRLMERGIRALKREMDASNKLGIDTKEVNAKIKQKTREYKEFCRKCNVPEKTSNLRVDSSATDITKTKEYEKYRRTIDKSQEAFDELESFRKGITHRKNIEGVEIIDDATYNKLIRKVKRNGGIIIRGTEEVEAHLARNNSTAACIGDTILFSEKATISDVLEETYHFNQNIKKMNNGKPAKERMLLNEIDAQKYLLSVADKYHIPEVELEVTRSNLKDYENALEEYYESFK